MREAWRDSLFTGCILYLGVSGSSPSLAFWEWIGNATKQKCTVSIWSSNLYASLFHLSYGKYGNKVAVLTAFLIE